MAVYQAPRSASRARGEEELARFPVGFRVVELASGRLAAVRAAYVGKDYSGRTGNFFVHALVFEGGSAGGGRSGGRVAGSAAQPWSSPGAWPIDLYGWEGWVAGLGAGEEDRSPEMLKALALDDFADSRRPDLSFEKLAEFLQGRAEGAGGGGSRAELAKMVRAVFLRTGDSRNLVVRGRTAEEGVYWLACVQKAFPRSCWPAVACSTYQFGPRSALPVNATVEGTDFGFDETQRKFQFYMFDFTGGEQSEVPVDGSDGAAGEYADKVAEWMTRKPKRLAGFHDFAERFDRKPDRLRLEDLVRVLRLYRLLEDDVADLRPDDVLAGVELARDRLDRRYLEAVLGRVPSKVKEIVEGVVRNGEPLDLSWARLLRRESGELNAGAVAELLDLVVKILKEGGGSVDQPCRAAGSVAYEALGQEVDWSKILSSLESLKSEDSLAEQLVVGTWSAAIGKSTDSKIALAECRRWAGEHDLLKAAWRTFVPTAFERHLSEEEQRAQAREWLDNDGLTEFEERFKEKILDTASLNVRFDPEDTDSERLAAAIAKRCRLEKLARPPRIVLRTAAGVLANGQRAKIDWSGVDEETYREFVRALNPAALLAKAEDGGHYRATLLSLVPPDGSSLTVDSFMKPHIAALARGPRQDGGRSGLMARLRRGPVDDASDAVAAAAFWLGPAPPPSLETFRDEVLGAVAERIADMGDKEDRRRVLEKIFKHVAKKPATTASMGRAVTGAPRLAIGQIDRPR